MRFRIHFLPEHRTYEAHGAVDLALAAANCDIWLEQPCGAKHVCGKCRVRVREGHAVASGADWALLTAEEIAQGWRLGCTLVLAGSVSVEVPESARSVAEKPFGPAVLFPKGFQPNVVKRCVELASEDTQVTTPLERLTKALAMGALGADAALLHELPRRLWQGVDCVTAVLEGSDVLGIEPGDTRSRAFGIAVDLGTTTLAGALVDLRDGRVIQASTRLNPQVQYGSDVISRIRYAQELADGSRRLHQELVYVLREMCDELLRDNGVRSDEIYAVAMAGNATMTHTAAGAEITPLGVAPYTGLWKEERTLRGSESGLPVNERARVRLLPMIGSHVGGDAVAAAVAAGLDKCEAPRLLLDLGTNSELLLGLPGRLLATSTAAGPAFEGANISSGMRAAPGAIDVVGVTQDGEVVVKTVDDRAPRGICGSGLMDAVAELLRAGVIAPSGYMKSAEEASSLPAGLQERCRTLPDGAHAFVLADDVLLTARDVRQLQLAKGAVRAATELLLRHAHVQVGEVVELFIAGTFGNFLRKSSVLALGMLPDMDPERVKFVGNAAGVGTRMVLVDAEARHRAQEIARRCEYVELAGHAEYEAAFCAALPFPAGEQR